jgi:shikimate dehydrogenase
MTNASSETFHLGLIGWPLGHSLSPEMHNAALQDAGLAGTYRLYPVPPFPEGEPVLKNLLGKVKSGEIQGINVTIPHKQNVLKFMDTISPAARKIGAVNTISLQNGLLTGENTDWMGFWHDLQFQMSKTGFAINKHALVLGAGGSARAVVYALLQSGWRVNIASRRPEQANQLVAVFSMGNDSVSAVPLLQLANLPEITLIVNTTPVGMTPNTSSSPWPVGLRFPENAFLYDLIYNPTDTALMKAARSAGLPVANGLGMLIEQAALAFEIWTGQPAPREVFRQAAFERTTL